jgi:hypothetical protein
MGTPVAVALIVVSLPLSLAPRRQAMRERVRAIPNPAMVSLDRFPEKRALTKIILSSSLNGRVALLFESEIVSYLRPFRTLMQFQGHGFQLSVSHCGPFVLSEMLTPGIQPEQFEESFEVLRILV